MKPTTLCCLGLLALPLTSHAIDPGPASPQQQETEGWLQLQSSNNAASQKLANRHRNRTRTGHAALVEDLSARDPAVL